MSFNGGVNKEADLSSVIDFKHFEWLAQHAESGESNGKKVVVLTKGGTFDTYSFNQGGQGENNDNTLVIFNACDKVILSSINSNASFYLKYGPAIEYEMINNTKR